MPVVTTDPALTRRQRRQRMADDIKRVINAAGLQGWPSKDGDGFAVVSPGSICPPRGRLTVGVVRLTVADELAFECYGNPEPMVGIAAKLEQSAECRQPAPFKILRTHDEPLRMRPSYAHGEWTTEDR